MYICFNLKKSWKRIIIHLHGVNNQRPEVFRSFGQNLFFIFRYNELSDKFNILAKVLCIKER